MDSVFKNCRYSIHQRINFRSFVTEKTKLSIEKMKANYYIMDNYWREAPKGLFKNDYT